ncbi:hypothetical protein COV20_03240 [Candidatus Woesearchaeota archaeon CG10_big_fil_rev_8_21_14_0_10_45_16]|nr:MAG: hypothetical protein COV20_03240 [Candidatus Woesearchaeota archaeon CG10_big_fil_rev_8_21_14_0_10_45_16]
MKRELIAYLLIFLIFSMSFALANSFTYDNNGNLINDETYKYSYDGYNNLIQVNDTVGNILEEYTHDDEGNRIKKYEPATDTTTYYFSDSLVRVVNSSGTFDTYYYYDDQGNLLSRKDPDGSKFYYHPDHLGSTSLVTDEAGNVVEKTTYKPFGEVLEGGSDRYTYTGQELDGTGLMYYGARYYDPGLRQFVQPDTLLPDMYDPQALNRYAYVLNNPYKYTDPTGHFFFSFNPISFLFGQNSLGFLFGQTEAAITPVKPATEAVAKSGLSESLGKSSGELIKYEDPFAKSSVTQQFLKQQGFKPIENFPENSPARSLPEQFKMAKDLGNGKWELIRADTPHGGANYQHINHQIGQEAVKSDGSIVIKAPNKGIFDHLPIFSQSNVLLTDLTRKGVSSSETIEGPR